MTVVIKDYDSNVKKTFSGVGSSIDVVRDGTDHANIDVQDATYFVNISTSALALSSRSFHQTVFSRPGGMLIACDVGSGGLDASDNPIIKDHITDTFIVIDPAAVVGGMTTAKQYAKFIESKVALKHGVSIDNWPRALILDATAWQMISTANVPVGINALGYDAVRWINAKISSVPLKLFYVCSHGGNGYSGPTSFFGRQIVYFGLGSHQWFSDFNATDPVGLTGPDNLTQLVSGLNYGNDPGAEPPRLVWIDACDSAGAADSGNPNFVHDFATSFGIDRGLDNGYTNGVFLGWYGSASQYGNNDDWQAWRISMWDKIFAGGQNLVTAFDRSNSSVLRTTGAADHPQDTAVWWGEPSTSF